MRWGGEEKGGVLPLRFGVPGVRGVQACQGGVTGGSSIKGAGVRQAGQRVKHVNPGKATCVRNLDGKRAKGANGQLETDRKGVVVAGDGWVG